MDLVEHGAHVCDAADVPRIDISVEVVDLVEQGAHVRDAADVPRIDILVERMGIIEQGAHVRDVTGACGRQGRVIPSINKCVDLSFRSLGVPDASHIARFTYSRIRAYDCHSVLCGGDGPR